MSGRSGFIKDRHCLPDSVNFKNNLFSEFKESSRKEPPALKFAYLTLKLVNRKKRDDTG